MLFDFVVFLAILSVVFGNSDTLNNFLGAISKHQVEANELCPSDRLCCKVSVNETCPISNMPEDESTLVFPGGETRCIFSNSSPFGFQVI
jgi:hypothetical protein